jgi:inosine-uridine nucleoside N-ribohydrolase
MIPMNKNSVLRGRALAVLASGFLAAWFAAQFPYPSAWAARPEPVRVIFDTDIGPDVDDAGAVAVLHALAARGEARILAMGCCTSNPFGAPCLDALNTYYGRPDLPIGTNKAPGFLVESKYAERVARDFPNDLKSGEKAPDAATLYRKVLQSQPDRSVVMVAVGPLPNLRRLLASAPDRISPLSGLELLRRKVRLLSVMGGRYPDGKEWNFEQDPAAAARVVHDWPSPVLFSGFEIGARIHTGARLQAETPERNPVRAAYALYVGAGKDRESWDLTSVLAAVRGPGSHWTTHGEGSNRVDEKSGENRWLMEPDREHTYLVERDVPEQVKKALEDLMVQAPR